MSFYVKNIKDNAYAVKITDAKALVSHFNIEKATDFKTITSAEKFIDNLKLAWVDIPFSKQVLQWKDNQHVLKLLQDNRQDMYFLLVDSKYKIVYNDGKCEVYVKAVKV